MGKEGGFLEYGREDPGYRPKEERLNDFDAVELRPTERQIAVQAARCMDCGIPFCHACGCPVLNVIPEFNDMVYRGRWKEALDILLSTNPFPEFTGRICPAPCETSCVLGINDDPVTIRQIELSIIEAAFERNLMQPRPPPVRHDGTVAILGSGPAGLAAAEILNKAGYQVTVFEHEAKAGGILRYGIPDFKLEKRVVDRRVKLMEEEGVKFETGVKGGVDVSPRYLSSRFDAVLLTGGAREPRDLNVPGRELRGIHFAMDFLIQQNKRLSGERLDPDVPDILAEGKTVVVIGGGDTGADCLGTSLRQGARHVYQFEILPEPPPERSPSTPWPKWPLMRRDSSSHKEGGDRRWSVTTEAFLGDAEGCVRTLRCAEMEWVAAEEGARPAPRKVAGSEFTVEADLVLLAMGFVGPGWNVFVDQLGVATDDRGFIQRDGNGWTSDPGIFVAGDMTRGASLVVHAIADGINTARQMIRYLESAVSHDAHSK